MRYGWERSIVWVIEGIVSSLECGHVMYRGVMSVGVDSVVFLVK